MLKHCGGISDDDDDIYQDNSRSINIEYILIIREHFFCPSSPLLIFLYFVILSLKFKLFFPLMVMSKKNDTFDFNFCLRALGN